ERHQVGAVRRWSLEFRVPVPVWLLAIRGEEVSPARAHVSGYMLHDDGDRVGFAVERCKQAFVRALLHAALRQPFVIAEESDRVLDIRSREVVWHGDRILLRCRITGKTPGPLRPADRTGPAFVAILGCLWCLQKTPDPRDQASWSGIESGRPSESALDNSLFIRLYSLARNSQPSSRRTP